MNFSYTRNMKTKISTLPYHVSARCVNKMPYPIDLESAWEIYERYIYFLIKGFSFNIHSFVLMPNHFHMILDTPNQNISDGMKYFMRETSREINRIAGRINQLYGRRFYASVLSDLNYYHCAYKYVYYNPVKAGLCHKVEDYLFSTLRVKLAFKQPSLICCNDWVFYDSDLQNYLSWLNLDLKKQQIIDIKNGFRKKEFKFSQKSKTLKEFQSLSHFIR